MSDHARNGYGLCVCGHIVAEHMLQDPGYCRWRVFCRCNGYTAESTEEDNLSAHSSITHEQSRRPPTLNPEHFHIQEDGGGGAIVICRNCGSDATHWSQVRGWACSNCGAADADESTPAGTP